MFVIESLQKHHDRTAFSCGTEELDVYLRQSAGQDMRRNIASVFVVVQGQEFRVCGYYTLSTAGIPYASLDEDTQRTMPRYASLPAVRLGRLAVDLSCQGRRLGEFMLMDAMRRALQISVAWQFFVVDAKVNAIGFYSKFGFMRFRDDESYLFLSRKDVVKICDG
ncbi:MAG: GNAT family N-acetyltransferase [Synergistaceae bacterium]|nr:GNAT family N-acetyltransferase [Synergistaceae bacterium]